MSLLSSMALDYHMDLHDSIREVYDLKHLRNFARFELHFRRREFEITTFAHCSN